MSIHNTNNCTLLSEQQKLVLEVVRALQLQRNAETLKNMLHNQLMCCVISYNCIILSPFVLVHIRGINRGQNSNMETAAVRLYFLLEHNYSLVILHIIWI